MMKTLSHPLPTQAFLVSEYSPAGGQDWVARVAPVLLWSRPVWAPGAADRVCGTAAKPIPCSLVLSISAPRPFALDHLKVA